MTATSLSEADSAFFARHAPAALARRDAAYFRRQRLSWGDRVATGVVGLLGLYVLGWPALTTALVLVAGFWFVWLGDFLFWLARRDAIAVASGVAADDEYVWALLRVLRGERRDAAGMGRAGPPFGVSIVVDLVAGAAATALLARGVFASGAELAGVLRSGAFVGGAMVMFATGFPPLLVARLRAASGAVEPPLFRYGQRGIGLLVLVFALMAAGGGALSTTAMLTAAYVFLVAIGVLQWAIDLPRQQRAAEFLRRQLPQ